MLALAGHMSRSVLERYSHMMKAKREAVEALSLQVPTSALVGVPTIFPKTGNDRRSMPLVRY